MWRSPWYKLLHDLLYLPLRLSWQASLRRLDGSVGSERR